MDKRLALVVGISSYPTSPLRNPVNDARDIATKLESFGFDVIKVFDCDLSTLNDNLDHFEKQLGKYDAGLFFFAGHGVQIEGKNYLVTTDTDPRSERHARSTSVSLDDVLSVMNDADTGASVVILDACRNNPWERGWNRDIVDRGLAPIFAPKGTIIGYATSPGETAADGVGANGTYTEALLNHIGEKDRPIEVIFKRVRNEVAAVTQGRQTTWEHTSLSGEFYFDMSLSTSLGGYSASAYADANFNAEPGSFAEKTINALKSYNWYTQNPAIDSLNASTVQALSIDETFVIGRNILQAAHGSSGSAGQLIMEINQKLTSWPLAKQKALYDGILFEIFFDSQGAPRDFIKGRLLDKVLENRKYGILTPSFDFIAHCLAQAKVRMFVLPGQSQQVGVTVTLNDSTAVDQVIGVWVDGRNVMSVNGEASSHRLGTQGSTNVIWFAEHLSQMMKVPEAQLDIQYSPKLRADAFEYPYGMVISPV